MPPIRNLYDGWGSKITKQGNVVTKYGPKVRPGELEAMRLMTEHAPSVPIPTVLHSRFNPRVSNGQISMTYVQGLCIADCWPICSDKVKKKICREVWAFIAEIRKVPWPEHLKDAWCCAADGAVSFDPLLGDKKDIMPTLDSDEAVRKRMFELYTKCGGPSHVDRRSVFEMLPTSSGTVFTHGDIRPQNIMIHRQGKVISILDWEFAGWFPDYWEYANIMINVWDGSWSYWMDRTKPTDWDLRGIKELRKFQYK